MVRAIQNNPNIIKMKYTYLILLLFLSGCVTNKADWGKYRGTSNTTSVLIDNKVISHEELDKNTKKEAKYVDLPVINYLHQVNTNKIERVTAIDTSSIIPLMIDEKIKVGPFLFQIVGLRRPEFGGDALELTLVPSQFTKENRDDILHINFFDPTGKRIRTKTKGSVGTKKFEKVIYSLNINPKKIVAEITYLKDKSVKMIHDLLPDPFLIETPAKIIPRRTAQDKSFDWQGGVSDIPNAKYQVRLQNGDNNEVLYLSPTLEEAQQYVKKYMPFHDDLYVYDITGHLLYAPINGLNSTLSKFE